jgi:serine/threonine protein kinase
MICIPLYFIHKNDIVHRDLKPDNILQKFIGDKEIFLITDFGTSSKANTKFLTTIKNMTPFYASLEQINEEEAHPSFDIWALGIILYHLMAKI